MAGGKVDNYIVYRDILGKDKFLINERERKIISGDNEKTTGDVVQFPDFYS